MTSELQQAIERVTAGVDLKVLENAAQELSLRYRERTPNQKQFMKTEAHRAAYAIFRMPATYAAVHRVLCETKKWLPELKVETLLDLGSGPGTVLWAASQVWPELKKCTLLEMDKDLIALAQKLAKESTSSVVQGAAWEQKDLTQDLKLIPHDSVVLSYVLGELDDKSAQNVVQKAWEASKEVCVLIEPGTMHGFKRIREARVNLIEMGAYIVAPCPHMNACPMPLDDWCHFSERLERSFYHRYVKGASLGFEDEKYSYVVASRSPGEKYRGRILRHPMKHSGHLTLELCTANGIIRETISRKQGEVYKQARHLEWGDVV